MLDSRNEHHQAILRGHALETGRRKPSLESIERAWSDAATPKSRGVDKLIHDVVEAQLVHEPAPAHGKPGMCPVVQCDTFLRAEAAYRQHEELDRRFLARIIASTSHTAWHVIPFGEDSTRPGPEPTHHCPEWPSEDPWRGRHEKFADNATAGVRKEQLSAIDMAYDKLDALLKRLDTGPEPGLEEAITKAWHELEMLQEAEAAEISQTLDATFKTPLDETRRLLADVKARLAEEDIP